MLLLYYIKLDRWRQRDFVAVEISKTSIPVAGRHLTFERPFVYGIMDTKTGLPLLVGIMDDPGK